jgi:hypothetical protein
VDYLSQTSPVRGQDWPGRTVETPSAHFLFPLVRFMPPSERSSDLASVVSGSLDGSLDGLFARWILSGLQDGSLARFARWCVLRRLIQERTQCEAMSEASQKPSANPARSLERSKCEADKELASRGYAAPF